MGQRPGDAESDRRRVTPPAFADLLRVFARIGCLSFGGPAGQIALMHREIVEQRGWVDEERYLHALNFCHLLPGPEAQQLATWIGWRLHGVAGGLAAGLLFIIPGVIVMAALAMLYAVAADLSWFAALFLGIKAAVLAIVVQALLRIAGRALSTPFKKIIAAVAFAGLALFALPFPLVVLGAGLIGIVVARVRPDWLGPASKAPPVDALPPRPWRQSVRAVLIWGALWIAPMAAIALTLGRDNVYWDIGAFFSKLAAVTFGGAYAVLAYMAQDAVQGFGWLQAGEMADGLGLAETTPGPLILVTQFVGFLAAFREPGTLSPMVAGLIGAALTVWVTFVPCFLWIFTFAPWIDRMERAAWLRGGLATITAAVVGVIANLSLWFALHVLFTRVTVVRSGPVATQWPDLASFDWRAGLLAAAAALLIFRLRWGVMPVLALCAALGWGLGQVT
ncbi:MAG: hypothetical protein RLZZ58_1958 [Pseudomonadota bacterium]